MFWEKLRRWMYGRYGTDALNLTLLFGGLFLVLFARIFGFWPLLLVAYAAYGWAVFRTLSRNIPARQRELAAVLRVWEPVRRRCRFLATAFRDRKTYKYFRCPNCRQMLRAPRGRGKILVTCQRCRKEFKQKT